VSVAVRPLGWAPVFFSEVAAFASAVLAHHYPHVPNLGDMRGIKGSDYEGKITVLGGGTPCQSFSNAGNRGGLADPRGSLALVFARLARESHARWILWENVPGVLSSDRGRAFASMLSALTLQSVAPPRGGWLNSGVCCGSAEGYAVAWRVLDAQLTRASGFPHAVSQRRRRVWLVGRLGADWLRPAHVLFDGAIDPQWRPPHGCHTPPASAGGAPDDQAPVSISGNLIYHRRKLRNKSAAWQYRVSQTVTCADVHVVLTPDGIRRYTPVEEERLFGFPDHYTDVPFRGRPASLYARHNVLGNSWCINCARWVCERIDRPIDGGL
jgi:DNA (cytosine-5)-methyltransferase 1